MRVNIWCCTLYSHRHLIYYTWHLIHDTWYLTPALDMLYLTLDLRHMISDTGTWYVILDTGSPTLDIWHRYLTCHTWHLILTPNIWHMLTLTWLLSRGTSTLTWYCATWPDTITPDTYIIWHIHDYHFYRDLAWLLYCYQIFGTPVLLSSCMLKPLK